MTTHCVYLLGAKFNPQEMFLILWAFAKVQQCDDRLFGMVAREWTRQMNAGVVRIVREGGGFEGAWAKTKLKVVGGSLF
jgi:hypothetical protein